MTAQYDPLFVAVSIAIAIMASYVALDLSKRVSASGSQARWWWSCGPIALGVGIWSMHFVGMLAFHLPVTVGYDVWLVLLSVLVAVVASALALFVASRPSLPVAVLAVSSLLMGGAISGMHYIGMAAMRLPATITWRPLLVVLSVVIAVGASFVALLMAFRLRQSGDGLFRWIKFGAATVMGIAIAGMHYTGMAAAQFIPTTVAVASDTFGLHSTGMSVSVIAGTVVILSMALAGAAFDERARLLAREQRARREAETANRLKDEFLATLSHELRTPLNVILGRTQMLRAVARDPAKVSEVADAISRNSEALRLVVEDLLDVSRMTQGTLHLTRQSLEMKLLLEGAVESIRLGAGAKSIRLTATADAQLPRVMGDPARLQQVIWNLLTNAVKFTPAGGEVRADLRRQGTHVVLTVTDTGIGIDPTFLPHVFEMFRQAEPTTSRTQGGLGIGLSIARRLVELHGGTVTATSAGFNRGATFTVSLPHQDAEAFPIRTHAGGSLSAVQAAGTRNQ
jgi:diguanylate cyclase